MRLSVEPGKYIVRSNGRQALFDRYIEIHKDGTATISYERNDIVYTVTPDKLLTLKNQWKNSHLEMESIV